MRSNKLPLLSLRAFASAALVSFGLSVSANDAFAGTMHTDVSIQTYADFGQNKGRYVVDSAANALLKHIRQEEGGIGITYTDGTPTYYLPNEQGMINFSGTDDIGAAAAIAPNFTATVLHNNSINASFGNRVVGAEHAINYSSIEIRGSRVFRLAPDGWGSDNSQYDYMVQRQSKIITDATWNPMTSLASSELSSLNGQLLYHSGAGSMNVWTGTSKQHIAGGYAFIIGGINNITSAQLHTDGKNISLHQNPNYENGVGASVQNPLPNGVQGGDSGSPVFIYNNTTKQYEYIAAQQSSGAIAYGQARGNLEWTQTTLKMFDVNVAMNESVNTVYLNAVDTFVETKSDGTNSANIYSGKITTDAAGTTALSDADGNAVSYNGVQSGTSTWNDLSAEKDKANWYAYDANAYLRPSDPELFFTENLVFTSTSATNQIVLNDTVDLGIGYVEFNKGDGVNGNAQYVITSAAGEKNLLNSAGYVVNAGTEVHIRLNNPDDHMYEWRKTGAGDLYIDGNGDTNALLTLGGSGKTYLQQSDGYAAYNVLASSGATVVIKNKSQIARDFTFGAGGGTLDMNGNFMIWNNDLDTSFDGFSIHALTEQAVIANYTSGTHSALIFSQTGDQTWKGSFKDSADSSLQIFYNGGENSSWTLNSIHTQLQNANSGLSVVSGTVSLVGTLTEHAFGSSGVGSVRKLVENDWHYADAKMNVSVAEGATFKLGSHARLSGDVSVESGGTYVMGEGVQAQYEYIEGGSALEDTYKIREFYGHHGNVSLAENAELRVEYSSGTTSENIYGGKISGAGNMHIALGTDGASLVLTGENTFSGTKTLASGTLVSQEKSGFGDLSNHRWKVERDGVIASKTFSTQEAIFAVIDTNSTGTVALQADMATPLDLSNSHSGISVGALKNHVVRYGDAGTNTALTAYDADNDGRSEWRLGGGGGELVVNFKLSGDNDLILGTENASGTVTLANTANDFTGTLTFAEGIVLNLADDAVLGQANVKMSYYNRLAVGNLNRIDSGATGSVMLDKMANADLDLSGHQSLTLGALGDVTYSGTLTLAENQAYRFGGTTETLTLNTTLIGKHDLIVDGKSRSGGTVALTQAGTLSGDVTVMGYDAEVAKRQSGDITLRLDANNALAQAASVTVKDGGIIDLAGTRQSFVTLNTNSGGTVLESRSGSTLNVQNGDLAGTLSVSTLEKTGDGSLTLSGKTQVNNLELNGGTLAISGTFAADTLNINAGTLSFANSNHSVGTLGINAGARYDLKGSSNGLGTRIGKIRLNGGTLANSVGVSTNQQQIYALELGADSTIEANAEFGIIGNGHGATSLDLANNTLTKTGNAFFHLINTNVTAGTIAVQGGTVSFHERGKEYNTSIAASVLSEGGSFIITKNGKGTLTLSGEQTDINALSLRTGTIRANSDRMNLGNVNEIGGTLVLENTSLGILNDTLSTALTVEIEGDTTIDTQVAKTGNAGNLTLSGNVSGGHLAKTGLGTLTLSGSAALEQLTVREGTLAVAANSASESVAIAYGATLDLNDDTMTLGAGQSLRLIASENAGNPATLNGGLVLNGGLLAIELQAPSETQAALAVDSVARGDAFSVQKIELAEVSALKNNQSVKLANADWSAIGGENVQLATREYMDASFTTTQDGLTATFTVADGYKLWAENGGNATWTATAFGTQSFDASDTLVFNDSAEAKNVQIAENISAAAIRFDSHSDYTLSGSRTITTASLLQSRSGTTTIAANLTNTGTTTVDAGTLVLSGTNTRLNGDIRVNAGTLQLRGITTLEGTTTVNAGTLAVDSIAMLNGNLNVAESGNFRLSQDAILFLNEAVTLTLNNAETRLDGNVLVSADTQIRAKTLNVGTLSVNGGTSTISGTTFIGKTLELNSGTLNFNTVNTQLADTTVNTGNLALNGMASLSGNTVVNGGILAANGIVSVRGNLTVSANGNFQSAGNGMLVLEQGSALTFNNAATHLAGAVVANASSGIAAYALSFETLNVLAGTLELSSLSTVVAGNVQVVEGAKIVFDLSRFENLLRSGTTIELLQTDSLVLGEKMNEQALDVISQFIAVDTDSGSLSRYSQEWSYENSTLSVTLSEMSPMRTLSLRAMPLGSTAIPEPSTFALLAGLAALALVGTRRRRR